jgi:peptidoglycan/LPS O-acetylase OafA/YrhL
MEMHLKSPSFRHESKPQILPLTGMRIVLAIWVVVFHQIPLTACLANTWDLCHALSSPRLLRDMWPWVCSSFFPDSSWH